MQTIARTAYVPAARALGPLHLRVLDWLVALDAGYRNAHLLAAASEDRLADMGITRDAAEAEFARRLGSVEHPRPVAAGW